MMIGDLIVEDTWDWRQTTGCCQIKIRSHAAVERAILPGQLRLLSDSYFKDAGQLMRIPK